MNKYQISFSFEQLKAFLYIFIGTSLVVWCGAFKILGIVLGLYLMAKGFFMLGLFKMNSYMNAKF